MTLRFAFALLILCTSWTSYACKCSEPGSVKDTFLSTDAILHGKVLRLDTVVLSETIKAEKVADIKASLNNDKRNLKFFETLPVLKVELQVSEVYKGKIIQSSIIVYTPLLGGSCGYLFEKGKEYIVYASKKNFLGFVFQRQNEVRRAEQPNTFWTNQCTRTKEFIKAETDELRALKNKS